MTQGVGSTAAIGGGAGVLTGASTPAATVSLLPSPSALVGSIESLYLMMTEAQSSQQKSAIANVDRTFADKHVALERYKEQVNKAVEDAKSGSLFKDLATVGMVVVAAAAIVMTFGTATPVVVGVGLALSASGFAVSQTKCLDPLLGDGVSSWVGLGLQVCGAIVGACAPSTSCASTLETVADTAEAGSTMATGAQKVEDTLRQHTADTDMAEATKAQQQMRRFQSAIDDVIAQLQDAKDTSRRGADTVNHIVETRGETLVLAAGGARA